MRLEYRRDTVQDGVKQEGQGKCRGNQGVKRIKVWCVCMERA
jgi:hypothetical protein